MTTISSEKKKQIIAEFGGVATNTGSTEAQVALITQRIQGLSDHLRENKQDHSSRRALLKLVGQRKSLLNYLQSKNLTVYRALIEKLGIRK